MKNSKYIVGKNAKNNGVFKGSALMVHPSKPPPPPTPSKPVSKSPVIHSRPAKPFSKNDKQR